MKGKILNLFLYIIFSLLCFIGGMILRFFYEESRTPEVFIRKPLCHMDSLKVKVISKGDVQSYIELRSIYLTSKFPDEFLFYSIVMAKQYNYLPANEHVCYHFKSFYDNPQIQPMDSFTDSIYQVFYKESINATHK